MADTIKTNLGPVTAYADAKAHGYTGTREEFGVLLANAGLNLKAAETAKEGAEAAKQAAETAQQAAAENQKNTETQAANAKASADTAAEQAAVAKESAADAANSATAAQESETNAGLSATAAANAEAAAKQAQNAAETAKADAETAKTAAGNSADAAANSAADAKKTLESIPDDYSTLSGKVDENANGISELKEDLTQLIDNQTMSPKLKLTFGKLVDGIPDGSTSNAYVYSDMIKTSDVEKIIVKFKTQGTLWFVYYNADESGNPVFDHSTAKGSTGETDYTKDFKSAPYVRLYGYYSPTFSTVEIFATWFDITMATGLNDRLKEIEQKANRIETVANANSDTIKYGEAEYTFDDWEQGAVNYSSANRISNTNYHSLKDGVLTISTNPNYAVHYYEYKLENGVYTQTRANSGLNYCGITLDTDSTLFYKFSLYCPNGITPSDVDDSGAKFIVKTKTNFALKSDVYAIAHEADVLPATWLSKIEDIKTTQKKCFTFGVQTDTHFDSETATPQIANTLRRLTSKINMDFICNLGDIIRGYSADSLDKSRSDLTEIVSRYIDGARCPVLFSVGNHDDGVLYTTHGTKNNSIDEVMHGDELHGRIIKAVGNTIEIHSNQSNYYYVDFEQCRVIVLDTRDIQYIAIDASDVNINHHAISSAQLAWLTSVALDTANPIIVMCHVPLVENATGDNIVPDRADDVINALKTHKASGNDVIGCFYGHVHAQKAVVSDGINHIVFANGGNFAEVVMVDTSSKTINTKMIGNYGNKVDRQFTY